MSDSEFDPPVMACGGLGATEALADVAKLDDAEIEGLWLLLAGFCVVQHRYCASSCPTSPRTSVVKSPGGGPDAVLGARSVASQS